MFVQQCIIPRMWNELKSDIDARLDRDKLCYLKDQIYVGDVHLVMKSINMKKGMELWILCLNA